MSIVTSYVKYRNNFEIFDAIISFSEIKLGNISEIIFSNVMENYVSLFDDVRSFFDYKIWWKLPLISGIFGNEARTFVEIVVIVKTVVIPNETLAAVAS